MQLSIIIPVYNAERTLERCLQSVLDQDSVSYEVILVDDGSTDSSPAICDRYAANHPEVSCIHQPNSGVSAARNAGLDKARGQYVMFLDSDDTLMHYALDDMFSELKEEDFVLGGYGVYVDGVPTKEIRPDRAASYKGIESGSFFEDNVRRNCLMLDSCWAKLFRREKIAEQRFDEKLCYAEDKLFVLEFLLKCDSYMTVASAVYGYHVTAGSLGSDTVSDKHLLQLRNFLPKYAELLSVMEKNFPDVEKVQNLYHNDLVGRYLCRILNLYVQRESQLLTSEYLDWVYEMMDGDIALGVFSLRVGQIPNLVLYKIHNSSFSMVVYAVLRRLRNIFCG